MDADPAAAMRYTECHLTALSQQALLANLNPSIIPYLPNFDGIKSEPTILPSKLPFLLLNSSSSGIAVGMATNIPPHNLHGVMTACSALLEARMNQRDVVSDEELLQMIRAPDFPTGALILHTDGPKQLYQTAQLRVPV